ncbi:hypothetical protein L9F63_006999 [Diploptera punctata]|uniref:Uncharacterized protein n=1 Tax=Diploptera punctata TaxID=6984 RepID=A0AAD8E4D3_DIPPU|nr:hypothetical protein L9F63_006999 [Diploptera punctata]
MEAREIISRYSVGPAAINNKCYTRGPRNVTNDNSSSSSQTLNKQCQRVLCGVYDYMKENNIERELVTETSKAVQLSRQMIIISNATSDFQIIDKSTMSRSDEWIYLGNLEIKSGIC